MPQKKKKKEEESAVEVLKQIREAQEGLIGEVEELKRKVSKVEEEEITPEVKEKKEKKREDTAKNKVSEEATRQPIPEDYKLIVHDLLGDDFGIQLTYMKDKPEFMFTIVVPQQYSDLSPEEYKERGADLRSRIIPYAEGSNGVKIWCETVKGHITKTMQAKIGSK